MNWQQIKEIAAKRKTCSECNGSEYKESWPPYGGQTYERCYHENNQDRGVTTKFIISIDDSFDKIAAVVDAAKELIRGNDLLDQESVMMKDVDHIRSALENLEK